MLWDPDIFSASTKDLVVHRDVEDPQLREDVLRKDGWQVGVSEEGTKVAFQRKHLRIGETLLVKHSNLE